MCDSMAPADLPVETAIVALGNDVTAVEHQKRVEVGGFPLDQIARKISQMRSKNLLESIDYASYNVYIRSPPPVYYQAVKRALNAEFSG